MVVWRMVLWSDVQYIEGYVWWIVAHIGER